MLGKPNLVRKWHDSVVTPLDARRMWRLLEPIHAVVYFHPGAKAIYEAAGLKGGWMGYFASRAAAFGPVPAEVVTAAFYNFHPQMVRRAIPDAWTLASPAAIMRARLAVAEAALRRLLGDDLDEPDIREASQIARALAGHCDVRGRPLFAAHAALPWPDSPHMVLWHAATLLREFRGDGHVMSLLANEIDGCEANVMAVAAGTVDADQRRYRGWSEEEWEQAVRRLQRRGLLDGDSALTKRGGELRDHVEALTDRLALPPFEVAGDELCRRLEALLRPLVARILETDGVPYPNAMGLTRPNA